MSLFSDDQKRSTTYVVRTLADSGLFSDFSYQGGVKSTVFLGVFEEIKFKIFEACILFEKFHSTYRACRFLGVKSLPSKVNSNQFVTQGRNRHYK